MEEKQNEAVPTTEELGPKIIDAKVVESSKGKERKRKIELILLAVLSLVFIYVTATTFFFKSPKAKFSPAAPSSSALPATEEVDMQELIPLSSENLLPKPEEKVKEERSPSRSPFSFGSEGDESKPLWVLQGIVRGAESYAIIDQKIVKEGGRIDDKTLKEISEDSVVLEAADGQKTVLTI
jgi:hypothetical protein